MTPILIFLLGFNVNSQSVETLMRERITPHMSKFQNCFLPDLQKDRSLAVQLKLKWTVDENGKVIAANVVETNKKLDLFEKCMLNEIKKVQFEPEGVKYDFEYTFNFRGR